MGLEVINSMQKEIESLKKTIESQKTEEEKKLEELKKELGAMVEERKTQFDDVAVTGDTVKEARKKGAELHLKSVLLGRDVSTMDGFKEVANVIEKAIKPTDLPSWLAEEFSNQVVEELELALKVESLFPKIMFPDNINTFSIPGKLDEAVSYLIAPGADAIESAIQSAKVSFQTKRFKTLVGITDQANQETVTSLIDIVRGEMVMSLARASEKAIVMGDTGIADANDVKKAFDGLLKYARDAGNTVDNGGGAVTAANIAAVRKKLGVYGMNLSDLVIVAPVNVAYQMLELPEVLTFDKYGNNFTILKGEIGRIWGMPIVVSEYIPNTLKADGTEGTPGTDDKTALLVVNKQYFAVADRGNVGLETERKAVSSTTLYVSYRDLDFNKIALTSTPVAALINVA
jgi:HK97 family phage major capsid protein